MYLSAFNTGAGSTEFRPKVSVNAWNAKFWMLASTAEVLVHLKEMLYVAGAWASAEKLPFLHTQ